MATYKTRDWIMEWWTEQATKTKPDFVHLAYSSMNDLVKKQNAEISTLQNENQQLKNQIAKLQKI